MVGNQLNLSATDIKIFVPAQNFEQSLHFYAALGWTINWQTGDNGLAELELAGKRFLLQNFYVKQWADNFMMQITVEDAAAWYTHISDVLANGEFGKARVKPPKKEDYGALVTYVWDPSGVLLHLTQDLNET